MSDVAYGLCAKSWIILCYPISIPQLLYLFNIKKSCFSEFPVFFS